MNSDELEFMLALPPGIIVAFPYSVVDASVLAFLHGYREKNNYPIRFRRVSVTSGSCRYLINVAVDKTVIELGEMTVRMMKPDFTTVEVTPAASHHDQQVATALLRFFLNRFSEWLTHEQQHTDNLTKESGLVTVLEPFDIQQYIDTSIQQTMERLNQTKPKTDPKPRGAPTSKLNDWARREMAQGRNQKVIEAEYVKRAMEEDSTLTKDLARDRFRKAISSQPKKSRMEGNKS
ncbi:MAG: hypothetical protein M3R24_12700 [Chloroflexota bacterium]|nr:hypothetical protein [Chloroflexota bacterium]